MSGDRKKVVHMGRKVLLAVPPYPSGDSYSGMPLRAQVPWTHSCPHPGAEDAAAVYDYSKSGFPHIS